MQRGILFRRGFDDQRCTVGNDGHERLGGRQHLADGGHIHLLHQTADGGAQPFKGVQRFGFIEVALQSGLTGHPIVQVVIDVRDPVALDLFEGPLGAGGGLRLLDGFYLGREVVAAVPNKRSQAYT